MTDFVYTLLGAVVVTPVALRRLIVPHDGTKSEITPQNKIPF